MVEDVPAVEKHILNFFVSIILVEEGINIASILLKLFGNLLHMAVFLSIDGLNIIGFH